MTKSSAYRYLRHIDLPQIGFAGQEKISAASVALVGLGGLGAAASLYLAGAGVGTLILIDDDRVDENNLQRQILYCMEDVGAPKAPVAAKRLASLNPQIKIISHQARLDEANAEALLKDASIVLDCSDNFATRFLLNAYCVRHEKTLISASVQGFAGQLGVYKPHAGKALACYQCLFPQTPPEGMVPTCPETGVFGPVVGMMGVMQAGEALKELTGLGEEKTTYFLTFDCGTLVSSRLAVARNPHCPCCGNPLK
jgi:adenylyltransferase/sulfurtransferase